MPLTCGVPLTLPRVRKNARYARAYFQDLFGGDGNWRRLLVGLAMGHAAVCERASLGCEGFRRPYEFGDEDLSAATASLEHALEAFWARPERQATNRQETKDKQPTGDAGQATETLVFPDHGTAGQAAAPWPRIRHLVACVHYGGHAMDEADQCCLMETLSAFLRSERSTRGSKEPSSKERSFSRGARNTRRSSSKNSAFGANPVRGKLLLSWNGVPKLSGSSGMSSATEFAARLTEQLSEVLGMPTFQDTRVPQREGERLLAVLLTLEGRPGGAAEVAPPGSPSGNGGAPPGSPRAARSSAVEVQPRAGRSTAEEGQRLVSELRQLLPPLQHVPAAVEAPPKRAATAELRHSQSLLRSALGKAKLGNAKTEAGPGALPEANKDEAGERSPAGGRGLAGFRGFKLKLGLEGSPGGAAPTPPVTSLAQAFKSGLGGAGPTAPVTPIGRSGSKLRVEEAPKGSSGGAGDPTSPGTQAVPTGDAPRPPQEARKLMSFLGGAGTVGKAKMAFQRKLGGATSASGRLGGASGRLGAASGELGKAAASPPRSPSRRNYQLEACLRAYLGRELRRTDALLRAVYASLQALSDMLAGSVPASEALEGVLSALTRGRLPDAWQALARPSRRPLRSWLDNLQHRVEWLRTWCPGVPHSPLPPCYPMALLVSPRDFLACVLQGSARKRAADGIGLEMLEFEHEADGVSENPRPVRLATNLWYSRASPTSNPPRKFQKSS